MHGKRNKTIKYQIHQRIRILYSFKKKRRLKNQKSKKYTKKSHGIEHTMLSQLKSDLIRVKLPINLKYLTSKKESPFYLNQIKKENYRYNGEILMPIDFSILDNPQESYTILKRIISALLVETTNEVILNYKNCKHADLSSQVLLDIIWKDFWIFRSKCKLSDRNKKDYFATTIGGINIQDENVRKLLFSVGSPCVLNVKEQNYADIIKYKLCIHDNEKEKDYQKRMEQKELDTSEMADYVIDSLKKMNKKLTSDKRADLCTVIGEILINAEEHSTTKYRFSIGYFQEEQTEENHFGIFRLVILNFGQTIYEKFNSPNCSNQDIVLKMKSLSKKYTEKNWIFASKFEEETLWTLYALQEGVTSIPYRQNKRGNGSIQFIESFFNIKGSTEVDNISKMSIVSGQTRIIFDGKYNIRSKINTDGDKFQVMTFNDSGNIEDKPDNNYVYCAEHYFPGTLISAKILLNDDDLNQIKN